MKYKNIFIENDFSRLYETLSDFKGRKAVIVTDNNVAGLYADEVMAVLGGMFSGLSVHVFKAGEDNKNLSEIERLYGAFLDARLDRKSLVIALGGGVVGDMAGFAAATYMRGINFVQVPTTLLAMTDSSVGGKTGVDFNGVKNLVGCFHQPETVYINTATLRTLPEREFSSGMAEVIKHGLIRDDEYFDFIYGNREKIKNLEPDIIAEMICGSVRIKSEVVAVDERERGLREVLNFGHTVGHAVEALCEYRLPHGYCVTLGMVCALHLSNRKDGAEQDVVVKGKELMEYFGLPLKIPDGFKALTETIIYDYMKLDKKVKKNKINFVLLKKSGDSYTRDDLSADEILEGIGLIL